MGKSRTLRFVGKAAPETTTIAFNATKREKQILIELARDIGARGHSEIVRDGYLEWMFTKHPAYALRIQSVRDTHLRNVAGRVAAGVKKRACNIGKAHAANTIQKKPIVDAEQLTKSALTEAQKDSLPPKPRKPGSASK